MGIGTCTRLTMVKSFTYRGNPNEEFSNTYTFKVGTPPDAASWTVLMNDVLAQERAIFTGDVNFVRAYGYDSNDPKKAHVFAHDFTVPGPPPTGTMPNVAGAARFAGDQAACVWWLLDRKSDKGKPTYLRKYIHHGFTDSGGGDSLSAVYFDTLASYATAMVSLQGGLTSPGGPKDDDPGPGGSVVGHGVIGWSTTRTLKRRGKRPKTGA